MCLAMFWLRFLCEGGAECLGACLMFDEEAAGGGAGLAEGDGAIGMSDEEEFDPTVPFEHGDPGGNFFLQTYAVPPPRLGYKAPPVALKGGKALGHKGGKAPVHKGGKAPVDKGGKAPADKGGEAPPRVHKGSEAVDKGGKAPVYEDAEGAKSPGSSVVLEKGKDAERLSQWISLRDSMLPADLDHELDAEALSSIDEEGEKEDQLSVPSSCTR